jgi:hypothetical protein
METTFDKTSFESLKSLLDIENFRLAPYFNDLAMSALVAPNPKLTQALANSQAKGLPPVSVLPLSGQYLSILTQLIGAKTVLEIGTLGGYSSIRFAQAAGARVTSIEISPGTPGRSTRECGGTRGGSAPRLSAGSDAEVG